MRPQPVRCTESVSLRYGPVRLGAPKNRRRCPPFSRRRTVPCQKAPGASQDDKKTCNPQPSIPATSRWSASGSSFLLRMLCCCTAVNRQPLPFRYVAATYISCDVVPHAVTGRPCVPTSEVYRIWLFPIQFRPALHAKTRMKWESRTWRAMAEVVVLSAD